MTIYWVVRAGAMCTLLGSVDAPSGLRCGGTPGSSNDTYCRWGHGWKHFGTDRSLSQGCTQSVTTIPTRDRA